MLYLPKEYSKNKKEYPLVIYLHGGSQKGNDLERLKGYGFPYMVSAGKDFNFIIASPQCPDNKFWSTDNWFDLLYYDLTRNYRIDKRRIYLTGISMGGYGAFITALDYPDKFAAIVPLCGGVNDTDTLRICNLNRTSVWAFHGTADDKVSINETERVISKFRNCKTNAEIKFSKLENAGHGIEYLYETEPEIYTWMLKHKKGK